MIERSAEETHNLSRTASDLHQLSGLGAMLGGGLFVLLAVVTAAMPRGCIAEECAYRPIRESAFGGGAVLALLFLAAGAAGLVFSARRAGRFGRLGWVGLFAVFAGVALLAVGLVGMNAWRPSLVPEFVIPGGILLILGFLLVGIAVLLARVLPPWTAALLVAGTLAMLLFNDQDWRALMAVPFGLSWAVVGYVLWSVAAEMSAARKAGEMPRGQP